MSPSIAQLEAAEVKKTLQNGNQASAPAEPAQLDASLLQKTLTDSPKPVPAWKAPELAQQRTTTDHMITATWTEKSGWAAPCLVPYGPLSLEPTASTLQYATTCFEGMKAYRGHDGALRLFRPDLNCARMQNSAARIALPSFPASELLALISALLAQDAPRWLPRDQPGTFLYVRPTLIATDPSLGVQKPKEALLYVVLSMFLPFDENPKGLRLLASEADTVRAWPGGFGYAKVGANYGPTLVAQGAARKMGFDQVLWLLPGLNGGLGVTEAGASNFFVVWKTKEGKVEMVTAPLGNKIILDGVTRRSLVELSRERLKDVSMVERDFEMGEIVEAADEGRLLEAFTAGTAFFVSSVCEIRFGERDLELELDEGGNGKYAGLLKDWMKDIMYGPAKPEWGCVVEE